MSLALNAKVEELTARIEELERVIQQMADNAALASYPLHVINVGQIEVPTKRGPGRPRKEA